VSDTIGGVVAISDAFATKDWLFVTCRADAGIIVVGSGV